MIQKKTWDELITNNEANSILDNIATEAEYIDSKLNQQSESFNSHDLADLVNYVKTYMLSVNGVWKDLPIYVSSFKFNDKRIIHLIKNKVREYLLFYRKLVTDNGVSRNLAYVKNYTNAGTASSVERGTNSETPQNSSLYNPSQPESDSLFDEAIADYASHINKNKASSESSNKGNSETLVTGGTWDEQKKNLQLVFFNELKEYIISIPDRIYSYYSIDTIPFTELQVLRGKYYKELADLLESYE